ncbi:hypothetical protein LCGC14_3156420 [marine sediment metagenome]|uniref:HTH cro/C1-type domain-containing protein n=1 Tax=marine sediment metagenome TaxID=412755 RepID=A0A0F8VSH1_9ZZZZ
MDELWTIRPVKSSAGWTMRPVLKWRRFGTIRPMRQHLSKADFQLEFKKRLKDLRERKFHKDGSKWIQDDMAEALNASKIAYPKWEQPNSDKNFPMYLLPALCEILERDPWDILTGESPAQSPGKRKSSQVSD